MVTEVIPLGTASAIPTKERHLSATALVRQGSLLLFDCGEGTQLRLLRAGLKRSRIEAILISHFHGDHFYGLPGVLSTLDLLGRREPLTVVGPAGIGRIVSCLPGLAPDRLSFRVDYVELPEDFAHARVLETATYYVEARPLAHRIFTAGFRFQEKPRPGRLDAERARALGATDYDQFRRLKAGEDVRLADGRVVASGEVVGPPRPGVSFAYVSDTRPVPNGVELARGADLLYHEATFGEAFRENALQTAHSTAREAAEVAREAGAAKLLIGHFSARYADPAGLVDEARAVFQNTEAAQELKRYLLEPREMTIHPAP